MALFLPQRWRRQPAGPIRLDRANAIVAGGISFCYLPGQTFPELVSGAFPTETLVTRSAGPQGPQASWADAGSSAFSAVYGVPGGDITRTQGFSIFAIAAPAAQVERDTLIFMGDESGGSFTQAVLCFNSDSSGGAASNYLSYFEYSGGFKQQVTSSSSGIDGNWHTWCLETVSNVSADLYRDNVSVKTSSALSAGVAVPVGTYVGNTNVLGNNRGLEYPVALIAIFPYILGSYRRQSLQENPWQLFAPLPTRRYFGVAATLQYARPSSDIAANGWLPSTGSDLFAMLDETSADDGDYIYSPSNPTTQQFEAKLSLVTDPASSIGHTISIRLQAINADTNFDLDLVQNTTVLDSWTENVTVAAGAVTRTRTLSGAVADSITNYGDLRVRGVARA